MRHSVMAVADSGHLRNTASMDWPDAGLEHALACSLCGSVDRVLLHKELSDRIFFTAPGKWNLWRCERCGGAWLDPRPTEETIGLAYGNYYTHEPIGPAARPSSSPLGRLRNLLGNGYRNRRYATSYEPAHPLGWYIAWLFPTFRWTVDANFRFLPISKKTRPKVLDVGCGNGAWLKFAQQCGWETAGVEPDGNARLLAQAAGFDVRNSLQEWRDERFTHITLNHVIEHVHDPQGMLLQCWQLLQPGGHLYIETPNIDSVGHRLYGPHWRGLEPPRHMIMFNRRSLSEVVLAAGFANVRFHPSLGALAFTSLQSRKIASGLDPYSDGEPTTASHKPNRREIFQSGIGPRAEFLAMTATKPL